jgi:hypothetical protein
MIRVALSGVPPRRWIATGLGVSLPLVVIGATGWLIPPAPPDDVADRVPLPIVVVGGVSRQSAEAGRPEAPSRRSAADGRQPPVLALAAESTPDPIKEAKALIARCRDRYLQLYDYTCTLTKRERMPNGRLVGPHVMLLKVRTRPESIYLKFLRPNAGREAIWVANRRGGKVVVHDTGLGKLLAGTLALDPRSGMAMENCRHPIYEAGFGYLINELSQRWAVEMRAGETRVTIDREARVADRSCTLIESKHPEFGPDYLFHKVRVYIDRELGLPIRFEAYDWPRNPRHSGDLLEEYTYLDVRLDTGLGDADFDPENVAYAFGRF